MMLAEEGLVSLEVCEETLLFEVNSVVIEERDRADQLPAALGLGLLGLIKWDWLGVLHESLRQEPVG